MDVICGHLCTEKVSLTTDHGAAGGYLREKENTFREGKYIYLLICQSLILFHTRCWCSASIQGAHEDEAVDRGSQPGS